MKLRALLFFTIFALALYCQAQSEHVSLTPQRTANSVTNIPNDKNSYVIGLSDVLSVTVWKQPTLSGTLLVRPDGKISMPLLGDIQASALTPMQLAAQISTMLKKYMRDPEVSVVVSRIHQNVVYLLGEVGKKGPVTMTPDMTLLEAIASAGGLTDFAKKKRIYILRNVAGKQQKIPANYKKALNGDAHFNVALVPGDTIVVP